MLGDAIASKKQVERDILGLSQISGNSISISMQQMHPIVLGLKSITDANHIPSVVLTILLYNIV